MPVQSDTIFGTKLHHCGLVVNPIAYSCLLFFGFFFVSVETMWCVMASDSENEVDRLSGFFPAGWKGEGDCVGVEVGELQERGDCECEDRLVDMPVAVCGVAGFGVSWRRF